MPVYQLNDNNDGPSTTAYAQEISFEVSQKTIRLVDTPGYSWAPEPEQSTEGVDVSRAGDILARNKGRIERLKDPQPVGESLYRQYSLYSH